jgi:hypothetical protein
MKETVKFTNKIFKEQWENNLRKPIEVLEKPNEVVKIVDNETITYDQMFERLSVYFNNVDVIKIYSFIINYETTDDGVIVNSLEIVI